MAGTYVSYKKVWNGNKCNLEVLTICRTCGYRFKADTLRCVHTLGGHGDQVRALSIANGHLYSGSYDCTIKVSLEESHFFFLNVTLPSLIFFKYIYVYRGAQMWDVRTFSCTGTLNVNNEVFGLGTAAGHLFSGDENGTIKVMMLHQPFCNVQWRTCAEISCLTARCLPRHSLWTDLGPWI